MVLAVLAIPESPKFLYAKKRFTEAKEILAGIAKFNGVKNAPTIVKNLKFDTEQTEIIESLISN